MERCLCGIFIVTCVGAAPVTSLGLGLHRASPRRMPWSPGLCLPGRCVCPRGVVTAAASPSWLGDSGLIALGGLRLCSILCLVGDWESPPSPSLSPILFPKDVLKPGGWLKRGGVQSPSW